MLAVVNTPNGKDPVEIREVAEPQPAANEALVEVRAFSLNRGELRLFQIRPEGWRPGQDIGGVVIRPAANGSGPEAGARVVALTDNAGWAERAAVPAHRMAVLPDNVLVEEAAALPVAGVTARRCSARVCLLPALPAASGIWQPRSLLAPGRASLLWSAEPNAATTCVAWTRSSKASTRCRATSR